MLRTILTSIILVAVLLGTLQAAGGIIKGKVIDEETGEPLVGANVTLKGTARGSTTGLDGGFVIENVPEGTYTLVVSYLGYAELNTSVTVAAGSETTADVTLKETAIIGEVVVTTASRKLEKITEAPATINILSDRAIDELPTANVGELFGTMKGVDYVRTGVLLTGMNARGFNSAFNSKNLQMDDSRISTLIATGLAFGPMSPVVKEDIERVEVILGPSAALYGPNAHNGLVNTITKDPRSYQGTTAVVSAGNQSTFSGRLRHARAVNEKFAYKITGEYTQGQEFDWIDSVYVGTTAYEELELDRDFNSLRGGAALYFSPRRNSDIILSYGGSKNNFLSVTNAGRNQIKDWIMHIAQARFVSPRLFAQAYYTWSKTEDTYAKNQRTQNYVSFIAAGFSDEEARRRSFEEAWQGPMDGGVALPRGAVFKDNSQRFNGELQYNNQWGDINVVVGGQFQRDMADSKGTYLLDQDGKININQFGVYGQVEIPFGSSGFKAVLAARGDDHEKYGFNFIPKAALLYSSDVGTFRATYGRGIVSPTILNLEVNIFAGLVLGNSEGFTLSDGTKIEPLEVEEVQTIELGYKGIVNQQWYIDVNGYYNFSENFLSPLINIVPTAFTGGPLVTMRGDVPISEHQSGVAIGPGDFVLTYLNFGKVDTYGFDLGLNYYFNNNISLAFNYSFFDFSLDENDPKNDGNGDGKVERTDLPINTPKHKANLALNYTEPKWFGSVSARWVDEYDFFSGINVAAKTDTTLIYNGDPVIENRRVGRDFNEGPLGGFVNFDISLGYHITPNVTLAGRVVNVFDTEVREFVASPPIGRLFSLELRLSR